MSPIQDRESYKREFEKFVKDKVINNWFTGDGEASYELGETRQMTTTRTARFKVETDETRDAGWLHIKILDFEYEEVNLQDAAFNGFEDEDSWKVRSGIIIPHTGSNAEWLTTCLLKEAFVTSFDHYWPSGTSDLQVILRMKPEDVIGRIRVVNLGITQKDLRFGGYSLRVTPFRLGKGDSLRGSVRLMTLPVKDTNGLDPGFQLVVSWDAATDKVGNQGTLHDRVVKGLLAKLPSME
jgi:hypothetical protein